MASLDDSLGVLLISVLLATLLYGVTCTQTWNYYAAGAKDHRWIQILVATVFAADTIHQIIICYSLYKYIIGIIDGSSSLSRLVPVIPEMILAMEVTSLQVQLFFTWRIWRLSEGNLFLTGIIISIAMAQFGTGLAYMLRTIDIETWVQLDTRIPLALAFSFLDAIADITIASVNVWYLRLGTLRCRHSDNVLSRLMLLAVSTGSITSLCAIGIFVGHLLQRYHVHLLVYLPFFSVIGRLYANSFLVALNLRANRRTTTAAIAAALSNRATFSNSIPAFRSGSLQSEDFVEDKQVYV